MEEKVRFAIQEYKKYCSPKDYLSFLKDPESDAEGSWVSFLLLSYHKFWNSFSSNNLTMLEFGGGPSILTLISASPFVRKIVCAELTEANRREVEAWQSKENSSHDWSPFFKHVVQKLEGRYDEEAIKREEELRSKISCIIPCDVPQTKPLHLDEISVTDQQKFDIISTTLCLEAAETSDDAYSKAVVELSKLLKPGGYLIMAGVLGESSCMVEDGKVTEPLAQRALDKAGFKNLHFVLDYTRGWYFMYGVLPKYYWQSVGFCCHVYFKVVLLTQTLQEKSTIIEVLHGCLGSRQ